MTRFGWVMVTYFSVVAIGISAFVHPAPKLVWNASASAPVGLYQVIRNAPIQRGDMVLLRTPDSVRDLAAEPVPI